MSTSMAILVETAKTGVDRASAWEEQGGRLSDLDRRLDRGSRAGGHDLTDDEGLK